MFEENVYHGLKLLCICNENFCYVFFLAAPMYNMEQLDICRWIFMTQGPSLVEKWDLLWTERETTLKWDCMFSLVAIIISFV